jgi:hypothetical protein
MVSQEQSNSVKRVPELRMQRKVYVVVCFSLYQKKSLLYEECETPTEIHDAVRKCVQKDAHIISIRQYIRE